MAWTEADLGNTERARQGVAAALFQSPAPDVQVWAAIVLARAADSARAEKMGDDVAKRFPLDTMINGYMLPTIHAAIEINRNNPTKATELLQATSPYEWSSYGNLYAIYLRRLADLLLHNGKESAAEFQNMLDHRGIVLNNFQGALAHLGLARAYLLQGDTVKAKASYQDFLALWNDADPDIPILKEAKAEYAKLQ